MGSEFARVETSRSMGQYGNHHPNAVTTIVAQLATACAQSSNSTQLTQANSQLSGNTSWKPPWAGPEKTSSSGPVLVFFLFLFILFLGVPIFAIELQFPMYNDHTQQPVVSCLFTSRECARGTGVMAALVSFKLPMNVHFNLPGRRCPSRRASRRNKSTPRRRDGRMEYGNRCVIVFSWLCYLTNSLAAEWCLRYGRRCPPYRSHWPCRHSSARRPPLRPVLSLSFGLPCGSASTSCSPFF